MPDNPILKIDFVKHEAARYACERWHYSKKAPVNKLVRFGIWENEEFKGVIIFGCGASATIHFQYGLKPFEMCELNRVALTKHFHPVTRMIKIAIKILRQHNPGLRLITSFADPSYGHHGGIYQGGNWLYTGLSSPVREFYYNGSWRHATDVCKRTSKLERNQMKQRTRPGKYRYVMPLDHEMRALVTPWVKPFPKRSKWAMEAPTSQRRFDTDLAAPIS